MNTQKRVNQMAHLKQREISDSSCKAIIIDTILEAIQPLTRAELAKEITSLFHILVSPTRLDYLIQALSNEGVILFDEADRIRIVPTKEADFVSSRLREEKLRKDATHLWLEDIRSDSEISNELETHLAQALPVFLRSLFIKHGVSSYELFTSQQDQPLFNLAQISKDVSAQFEKAFQSDIEKFLPTIFQSLEHFEVVEYLKHGVDKAVGYICEVISDENLKEITAALNGLTVYLDTNTIYRLLNLQGTSRYEAIRETISFCIENGVKLKVSALTKKELSARLSYDAKVLLQFPTKTNLVEVGYKYRTADNYVSTYWLQAKKSGISVEDYIAYYRNFDILLSAEQIEIEEVEVDEEQLISRANLFYEKMSLSDPFHEKSEFGLWHDAYNFAYIQKMQKVDAKTAIDTGCLFLTTDQALTSFQREAHELQGCPPVVIAPSQLLQLFSFSKPDSGFEETFIKFFASSSLGYSFSYGNDDIQEILSRIEHYRGVNPDIAEKILRRELVNSRYIEAATEEEKEDIIYNSVSEELLNELDLSKAQIVSLKAEREKLDEDHRAALDLLAENEKLFSDEKERLRAEASQTAKQLEDESAARREAETSTRAIQKYSKSQEELYVNEKWGIWKTKHLRMFKGSIIAIIIIIIGTLLVYFYTKESGYFSLLGLIAIPAIVLPFACVSARQK